MQKKKIHLIGCASGLAAADAGCAFGPTQLQKSTYLSGLSQLGLELIWEKILLPRELLSKYKIDDVEHAVKNLANEVARLVKDDKFFMVFGGDHSCAIGTWSGVYSEMHTKGDLGLIWIDAHLDSHTEETSETGNIHGMPVAALLGYGNDRLINLSQKQPKIKPQNLCVVGARSFEKGEQKLLEDLNVKIFYMDEVKARGIDKVLSEAKAHVSENTYAYGISLDLDSIDPIYAPGTGCFVPDGIHGESLCKALREFAQDKKFIGAEIVEFDPSKDKDHITEKLITKLFLAMTLGQ